MPSTGQSDKPVRTSRRVKVGVTRDKLSATVILVRPDKGEPPLTPEEVIEALTDAGVTYGINHQKIELAIVQENFGAPLTVAKGSASQKGKDTEFEFFFETDHLHSPVEGQDGRIDYRNMNFIQNVTKGTVLVRRTMPTEGALGRSVTDLELPAARGRELPFRDGQNTAISEDGLELVAGADGAIVYSNGTVSVNDVLTIDGDVDYTVGNIECVGSVHVKGSVHAGFSVKAGGNIEVAENVEDCDLTADGNILVRGGFFGNSKGIMQAQGDITIKYAQNQRIASGGNVYVGGELIGCQVTAKERVIVRGRSGKIVGGEVNAGKEIRSSMVGSDAGTTTILTVAYDANLMRTYRDACQEIERLEADMVRVKESMCDLYKLQMANRLTTGQGRTLKKLEGFHRSVPSALKALQLKKQEVEAKLQELADARVVVETVIFPGARVHIGILAKDVDRELTACVLNQDGFKVQFVKYDRRLHGFEG